MVFADNQKGARDMSHYKDLSIEEREVLYLLHGQGRKLCQIADVLGRSPSTISRELQRNKKEKHAYSPSRAQECYQRRRKHCGRKHILICPEHHEHVRRLIQDHQWSPEEISNRLKLEDSPLQLSYNAIYRAIHAGLFDANKRQASRNRHDRFSYHLRRKGKKKNRKGEKNKQGGYQLANKIGDRPMEANARMAHGHFEADTIVGKRGGACLVTLVDRSSRFTLAAKVPKATAANVSDVMIALLEQLPPDKVKTITPDRGSEFALYQQVSAALNGAEFYFADPHSPWQRGTNENTNGLIREYVPKGSDFAPVCDRYIAQFTYELNLRPRKCLGWMSPFEVFFDKMLHLT